MLCLRSMKSFNKYYLIPFKEQFADFSGRATRKEFWMYLLYNWIVILFFTIPLLIKEFILKTDSVNLILVLTVPLLIYFLASTLPTYSFMVRRFHDTGRSAWNLLWYLLPWVGSLIALFFLLLPSEEDNKYGKKK